MLDRFGLIGLGNLTHDRQEVLDLADHLIVLDKGRILQSGAASEVFARPGDERVARMVGMETLRPGKVIDQSDGRNILEVGSVRLLSPANGWVDENVLICIRADDVEIAPGAQGLDDLPNHLRATIRHRCPEGPMVRLELDCGFQLAALVPRSVARSISLEPGSMITVHLPEDALHLIPQPEQSETNSLR